MTEFNPLNIDYGYGQGRVEPTAVANLPRDGEYVYLLGASDQRRQQHNILDYIEIKQAIDLTGISVLRFDAKMLQPLMMPQSSYLSGHQDGASWVYTATMQRTSGFASGTPTGRWLSNYPNYPVVRTTIFEPFTIVADTYLRVEVDKTGNQDIHFVSASPSPGGYTAAQVAAIINAQAVDFTATTETDSNGRIAIAIRSNITGISASIEIKDYPVPASDANANLAFQQKQVWADTPTADTAFFGADDLSLLIVPDITLTDETHLDAVIYVENATNACNNYYNRIVHILDEHTAVLHTPVETEAAGFDVQMVGGSWRFRIKIGPVVELVKYSTILWPGADVLTEDLAVNVSKFTGVNNVAICIELAEAALLPAP